MGKKKNAFDPVASLNELIADLQAKTGIRIDGEPGGECQSILGHLRESFSAFEVAVVKLHECGQTAAVEIILSDIERCMRRAIRLAGEYGGTTTGIDSPVLE